jgi:hypothetical protein
LPEGHLDLVEDALGSGHLPIALVGGEAGLLGDEGVDLLEESSRRCSLQGSSSSSIIGDRGNERRPPAAEHSVEDLLGDGVLGLVLATAAVVLPSTLLDDLPEADVALPLGVLAAPAEENVSRLNLVVGDYAWQICGEGCGIIATADATGLLLLFLGWRGGRGGGRRTPTRPTPSSRLIVRFRSFRRWSWSGYQFWFSRAR